MQLLLYAARPPGQCRTVGRGSEPSGSLRPTSAPAPRAQPSSTPGCRSPASTCPGIPRTRCTRRPVPSRRSSRRTGSPGQVPEHPGLFAAGPPARPRLSLVPSRARHGHPLGAGQAVLAAGARNGHQRQARLARLGHDPSWPKMRIRQTNSLSVSITKRDHSCRLALLPAEATPRPAQPLRRILCATGLPTTPQRHYPPRDCYEDASLFAGGSPPVCG